VTDLLALRQKLRAQRRALDEYEQFHLSQRAVQQLARHRLFRAAQHIACYLPNDAELDISPLINQAWAMGKTVYLPALSSLRHNHLHFLPYKPDDELVCNRYGIPEPVIRSRRMVDPKRLDMVLMPLVGFDSRGNRLGMGGGFYDHSFAFLRRRRCWFKPGLLGIAYDFQEVKTLQSSIWDVPLNGVATESGVRLFSGNKPAE
jgi:5-formyltetrahydrofolate cyclo-ligase